MYAHNYKSVRLAVPLEWQTRLISRLPRYLALEVPLTIVFLFALPVLLAFRRYRTLRPTSSTWRTAFHLLSGDARNSLITSAHQTIPILLVAGIASLLIQFPINSLKGQVVSATYEQRIQPSNCTITACRNGGPRHEWYAKYGTRNYVGRIEYMNHLERSLTVGHKLEEGCASTALSTAGMWRTTMSALLTQYGTICNEPSLLRMQLVKWKGTLVFEHLPDSSGTEALCSSVSNPAGHVVPRGFYQLTQRILAHDLLKRLHVKESLFNRNYWDSMFWAKKIKMNEWADPNRILPKINAALLSLQNGYQRYQMFDETKDFSAVGFLAMTEVFLAFSVAVALSIARVVCEIVLFE